MQYDTTQTVTKRKECQCVVPKIPKQDTKQHAGYSAISSYVNISIGGSFVIRPLLRDLREELLDLLLDELGDLLRELLGFAAKRLGARDNLAGDDVEIMLESILKLLDSLERVSLALGLVLDLLLSLVATSLNDLLVVAAATTVPGKQVGGIGGNVGQGVLGGNGDEVLLELLGGDGSDSVLGVTSRLQREVVGEKTADVGRGHGSARDGVDGILGANPCGLDVQTRGEDVSALSVVGEVSTGVVKSRSTDGYSLGGRGGRVVASVGVVIASSDGKVNAGIDSGVNGGIEKRSLASTKGHVGDGALETLALTVLGSLDLGEMAVTGEFNTLDDISHGAGSVGSENLDGVDVSLLGNTVLLTSDSTRAVSSVTVAINILITSWDSLTPLGSALEINMLDVGSGVNDVGINTFTTIGAVQVLVERAEAQGVAVRDTGKAPGSLLLDLAVALLVTVGNNRSEGADDGVTFDIFNLTSELVKDSHLCF